MDGEGFTAYAGRCLGAAASKAMVMPGFKSSRLETVLDGVQLRLCGRGGTAMVVVRPQSVWFSEHGPEGLCSAGSQYHTWWQEADGGSFMEVASRFSAALDRYLCTVAAHVLSGRQPDGLWGYSLSRCANMDSVNG